MVEIEADLHFGFDFEMWISSAEAASGLEPNRGYDLIIQKSFFRLFQIFRNFQELAPQKAKKVVNIHPYPC